MFAAFYSDPHFGHANIISFCSRPFADVVEMERELVARYNAVVGVDDCVLWVGDCFFTHPAKASEILSALHGRKVLVRGNHDRSAQRMASAGFDWVTEDLYFQLGKHSVRAVHYPYRHKPKQQEYDEHAAKRPEPKSGVMLMHGHTHSAEKFSHQAVHVGVDAWDYRPALRAEVEAILDRLSG